MKWTWFVVVAVSVLLVTIMLLPEERPSQVVVPAGVEIAIGYTRIDDGYYFPTIDGGKYRPLHAYVIARDNATGKVIATRSGPEKCRRLVFGSRSSSSGVGSNIVSCPRFCEDGAPEPTRLYAVAYEGAQDCDGKPIHEQKVGTVKRPFDKVAADIKEMVRVNNGCKENLYNPVGFLTPVNNSNSYAFSVVQKLVGWRPEPKVSGVDVTILGGEVSKVHGWDKEVGTNNVDCLLWPPRFSLAKVLEFCRYNGFWLTENSCTLPANRWITGADALLGFREGRQVSLNEVIAQTATHLATSESERMKTWSKKLDECESTYYSSLLSKHDFCRVSGKKFTAIQVIADAAAQASNAGL